MYETRVTIGIATFNGQPFVGEAIESAIATGADVIVSDDCSTDGTQTVLESYRDRIRLFTHETNRGIGANYQWLLDTCTTPLLHLLNQDDILVPRTLRRADPADDEVSIFNGWVIDDQGRHQRSIYRRPPWHATTKGLFRGLAVANFAMSLSQVVIPVEASRAVGGFSVPDDQGQGAEDHMLLLKLAAGKVRARLWMRRAILYRRHRGSFSSASGDHRKSMAAVRRSIPTAPDRDARLRLRW
jgi:hypothetical protein